jgi:hypothetical protein
MKKVFSILSIFVIAGLLAASFAVVPTSTAFAKTNQQDGFDDTLEWAFESAQYWLDRQSMALERADRGVEKVQQVIDKAAARGLDVSALEAALAAFTAELPTVKSIHQDAADILAAHDGFDNSGGVVDRQAARDTLMGARRALGEAHMTLTYAFWDFQDAVRDWKDATFPQE